MQQMSEPPTGSFEEVTVEQAHTEMSREIIKRMEPFFRIIPIAYLKIIKESIYEGFKICGAVQLYATGPEGNLIWWPGEKKKCLKIIMNLVVEKIELLNAPPKPLGPPPPKPLDPVPPPPPKPLGPPPPLPPQEVQPGGVQKLVRAHEAKIEAAAMDDRSSTTKSDMERWRVGEIISRLESENITGGGSIKKSKKKRSTKRRKSTKKRRSTKRRKSTRKKSNKKKLSRRRR